MEQTYPSESVGSIMSTAIPTCHIHDNLLDVLRGLSLKHWGSVRNVYVLDKSHKLLGIIDLATLVQADHASRADSFMQPVTHFLHPEADQEKAVFMAVSEDIVTIPVVDHDGHFLGSVTAHTIIDIMHSEHVEDALLTAGVRRGKSQIIKLATERTGLLVRSRMPWLVFGLVAGLGLGFLSSLFEEQLQQQVALAYFIPVVAYITNSVGTQTAAIIVRAFATIKINPWHYLARELCVGLMLGLVIGVLGGLGAAFIAQSVDVGFVVALSLFIGSGVAACLGAAVPMLLKAWGKDPALGSGPLANALQDIISILIYFMLAVAIL